MSDLIKRHQDVIAPVIAFDTDVVAERAQGIWVHASNGRKYADFASGTAVTNLGHNHPAVVAAAHAQIDRFVHSGCMFRYDTLVEAAERLVKVTPPAIEKFAFANSGAEAVEGAVKLTKKVTGRQGLVVFRGGFHGRTMGSVTYTTSNAKYRDGYHPVLGSVFVAPFPHAYRWGMSEDQAVDYCLWDLEMMFRHEVSPHNIAALPDRARPGRRRLLPRPGQVSQRIADCWPIVTASRSSTTRSRPDLVEPPNGWRPITTTPNPMSSPLAKESPTDCRSRPMEPRPR